MSIGPPRWLDKERAWHITRYADAAFLLKSGDVGLVEIARDLQKLSGRLGGGAFDNLVLLLGTSYPFQNPPAHDGARAALKEMMTGISRRWTPASVTALVRDMLAPLIGGGPFDGVTAIASRLPSTVVADALGLRVEQVQLCGALSREISVIWHREVSPLRQLRAMEDRAARIVDIFQASHGEDRRTEFARLAFLTMAGVDTTSGLIGSALEILASEPALQERLRTHPAAIPAFINETLRYRPPLRRLVGRRTSETVRLSDCEIQGGTLLVIDLGSAHRDPAAYHDPDRFDIGRAGPPNLAFGFGAHACVGAALARLEARILIERLLADAAVHRAGDAVRGESPDWNELLSLPVRLEPRFEA